MKKAPSKYRHIFLTGFMGSGKSTIGKQLAVHLKWPFIDSDDWIESGLGKEIKDIFKSEGEAWFRLQEEDSLAKIINSADRAVISLGGGTLISEINLKNVLSCGLLVYIKSSPTEIWKRIRHSTRRPLLRPEGENWSKQTYLTQISLLLGEREAGYQKAHMIIDRDGQESDQIVRQIVQRLLGNNGSP